jgi:FAD synthase
MCQHYDRITFNAKVMKHDMVMAAGEFLERAGLTRGRVVEGEVIQRVEGIPEKDLVPGPRVLH